MTECRVSDEPVMPPIEAQIEAQIAEVLATTNWSSWEQARLRGIAIAARDALARAMAAEAEVERQRANGAIMYQIVGNLIDALELPGSGVISDERPLNAAAAIQDGRAIDEAVLPYSCRNLRAEAAESTAAALAARVKGLEEAILRIDGAETAVSQEAAIDVAVAIIAINEPGVRVPLSALSPAASDEGR